MEYYWDTIERCVPPAAPGLGWDGASAWATLDGDLPRCTLGAREINPATMRAWPATSGSTGPWD